ncbi:MAG: hypothetical protein ACRD33_04185 [Candidatus Acidiferrales bacterium]
MNVTREVVTDLLPVYFSGEASGDTKVLVEDYFRGDPDFERIARSAATPLETLKSAAWPGAADGAAGAEKEKRGLESVRCELRTRRWFFGFALFFTLVPLAFSFTNGHIVSLMVRDAPWEAALYWSLAALYWFFYFARLRRHVISLLAAIFFTLLPFGFALHHVFSSAPALRSKLVEAVAMWIAAGVCWISYFRQRPR